MYKKVGKIMLVVMVCAIFSAGLIKGQTLGIMGDVEGYVKDQNGAGRGNIVVKFYTGQWEYISSTVTQANGYYKACNLAKNGNPPRYAVVEKGSLVIKGDTVDIQNGVSVGDICNDGSIYGWRAPTLHIRYAVDLNPQ